MTGTLWELSIKSFRGVSPGAKHWFGEIYADTPSGKLPVWSSRNRNRVKFEIEYVMNEAEAEDFTRADRGFTYRPGDLTERFNSRDALIAAAIVVWQIFAGLDDALILDGHGNPSQILAGPAEFVERGTAIWQEYESHRSGNVMVAPDHVYRAWDELMKDMSAPTDVTRPDGAVVVERGHDGTWVPRDSMERYSLSEVKP